MQNTLTAVNFSRPLEALRTAGEVRLDRYKLPAWPELIAEVETLHPAYIHLPLNAGTGTGVIMNTETDQPVDWPWIEAIAEQTGTPNINIHLDVRQEAAPEVDPDSIRAEDGRKMARRFIRDVETAVARYGTERVIVENDPYQPGWTPKAAVLPETIQAVTQATGCGLLLDLSHAWLSAHYLGMDVRTYIEMLPVDRLHEIHVSGVQPLVGRWLEAARSQGWSLVEHVAGKPMDHLPLVPENWALLDWAMERIRVGAWRRPWIVSMECGGIGGLFEAFTDTDILAEQTPRLYEAVQRANPLPDGKR